MVATTPAKRETRKPDVPHGRRPSQSATAADSLAALLQQAAKSGSPDRASLWLRALAAGEHGVDSTVPTSTPETKGPRRPQKGVGVKQRAMH
jgi:hypothetical protein